MSSLQSNSSLIRELDQVISNLSGLVTEDNKQSRDAIRKLWSGRILDSHVTRMQLQMGMPWITEILRGGFRKDGKYEIVITNLVKQLNGWPEKDGNLSPLDFREKDIIK